MDHAILVILDIWNIDTPDYAFHRNSLDTSLHPDLTHNKDHPDDALPFPGHGLAKPSDTSGHGLPTKKEVALSGHAIVLHPGYNTVSFIDNFPAHLAL